MGPRENELAAIAASGRFDVPEIAAVRSALIALAGTMKRVAGYTGSDGESGWSGQAARAASEKMEVLSARYYKVERHVAELEAIVDTANDVRKRTLDAAANLPAANAPSWVHGALDVIDFPGIPQPVDLAQGGLSIIEDFLGGQRENAAAAILNDYAAQLGTPAFRVRQESGELSALTGSAPVFEFPDDGDAPQPGGPAGPRSGAPYVPYVPGGNAYVTGGGGYPPYAPPSTGPGDGVIVGIDDPGTGVIPSTPGGPGTTLPGGSGGSGPGNVGTTTPGHIAGAGVGTALTGASTAAALKLGAGSPMIAGAAARLGTGGLLGATGAPGATGMVGGAGTAGSAVGTRPGGMSGRGSGLLGGTGTAGGGGAAGVGGSNAADKKRRAAGNGLGGPMAPKLDDDDEYVRQAPGARAGGRGEPANIVDEGILDAVDPDA